MQLLKNERIRRKTTLKSLFFCVISKVSWLSFIQRKKCKSYKLQMLEELCLSPLALQGHISNSNKLQLFCWTMEPLWWFVHLNQSYLSISYLAGQSLHGPPTAPIESLGLDSLTYRLTEFVESVGEIKTLFWTLKNMIVYVEKRAHNTKCMCRTVETKMFSISSVHFGFH